MLKKAVFFNTWHFGDLHSNKEYVRQFAEELIGHGVEVAYATAVAGRALNLPIPVCSIYDYPNLTGNPVSYFDLASETIYINTWIGYHLQMESHNFSSQKNMWSNLAFEVLKASDGNINIQIRDDAMSYVSQIDVDLLSEVSIPDGVKILFCNDIPISGQSHNGNWASAVQRLAADFPTVKFLCTNKFETEYQNILFTNDLTHRNQIICDLPEIGYLSESCKMIVTNSSGPGTFTMTRNNFLDSEKIIVAFVIGEGNTFWNGVSNVLADTSWYNVFDDESVYAILRDRIYEKIFNNSS